MTDDRFAGLRRALASRKVAIIDSTSDPQGLLTDDVRALLAAHDAAAVPADVAGMVEEAKRLAEHMADAACGTEAGGFVHKQRVALHASIDRLARLAAQGQRQGWPNGWSVQRIEGRPEDIAIRGPGCGAVLVPDSGSGVLDTIYDLLRAMMDAAPTQEADDADKA